MHAFEHLRHVARAYASEPSDLAAEAAWGLASLAGDHRALVTSCRRLIEAHRSCAPMWWVAARVLASADPTAAAYDASRALVDDETDAELASAIGSNATVVSTASTVIARVLGLRPDIDCRILGSIYELRTSPMTFEMLERVIECDPNAIGEAFHGASVAVVEATAASPRSLLVDERESRILLEADRRAVPVHVVVPEGRLLPERLFDVLVTVSSREREGDDGDSPVVVEARGVGSVVSPIGVHPASVALSSPQCPVVAELLQIA